MGNKLAKTKVRAPEQNKVEINKFVFCGGTSPPTTRHHYCIKWYIINTAIMFEKPIVGCYTGSLVTVVCIKYNLAWTWNSRCCLCSKSKWILLDGRVFGMAAWLARLSLFHWLVLGCKHFPIAIDPLQVVLLPVYGVTGIKANTFDRLRIWPVRLPLPHFVYSLVDVIGVQDRIGR